MSAVVAGCWVWSGWGATAEGNAWARCTGWGATAATHGQRQERWFGVEDTTLTPNDHRHPLREGSRSNSRSSEREWFATGGGVERVETGGEAATQCPPGRPHAVAKMSCTR